MNILHALVAILKIGAGVPAVKRQSLSFLLPHLQVHAIFTQQLAQSSGSSSTPAPVSFTYEIFQPEIGVDAERRRPPRVHHHDHVSTRPSRDVTPGYAGRARDGLLW